MTQRSPRRPALVQMLAPLAVLFAMACAAFPVAAAPEYITSGRLSELDATILAADTDGPVTALETLLYLDIARHPAREIPVANWLGETPSRTQETERRIREGLEEFLAARSLARQEPAVEIPPFLERRFLYSAAEAAWIEVAVTPEIEISDEDVHFYYIAHADRYTRRQQAQVRYIFFEIPQTATAADNSRIQGELEALRDRILAGEMTFDAAARLFSQAPSKDRGGLVPPFTPGDYFQEFERYAFDLEKIGDMSPVFRGPDGVYMVQLVSENLEPVRTPVESVSDEIRAALRYDHVRPYYADSFRDLARNKNVEDFAPYWEYIDDRSPVARVGRTDLTRDQLLQINPAIINARYDIQGGLLLTETATWIEGEIVMQELERLGQADHRLIAKARRAAHTYWSSQNNLRRRVDMAKLDSPRSALDTLRSLSPVASGVPEARVIQVTLQPDDTDPTAIGRRALQRDLIRQLSEFLSAGYLPTRPEATELTGPVQAAAGESDASVAELVGKLNGQLSAAPWPEVTVEVRDLGWIEALPGLSAHPVLPSLAPGEISTPQSVGERVDFYLVGAVRSAESTPWLEFPLVLQVAAYEVEARRLLREEIARVREEQGTIALP